MIEDQESFFEAPVGSLRLTHKAIKNSVEGIIITDKNATIVSCNQGFTDISGFQEKEVIGIFISGL